MLIKYEGDKFSVSDFQHETFFVLGGDAFAAYTILSILGFQVTPPEERSHDKAFDALLSTETLH